MKYIREIVNIFQGRRKLSEEKLNPYETLKFLKNFPTDASFYYNSLLYFKTISFVLSNVLFILFSLYCHNLSSYSD